MGPSTSKISPPERLDGKIAVITGCNVIGIGKETAKEFYERGATVIMACHNIEEANCALNEIKAQCYDLEYGQIKAEELDVTSLKSVRICANAIAHKYEKIDILINYAEIVDCGLTHTTDKLEMNMANNHFGHFLLTLLLMPKIKISSDARIINVSSVAYASGTMDFADINWIKRDYDPVKAYNQSKLANVLFTKELTRRLQEAGMDYVHTYCLHPENCKLKRLRNFEFKGSWLLYSSFVERMMRNAVRDVRTILHCAASDEAGKETGLFYAECKPIPYSPAAENADEARQLWLHSLKIVGLNENYNPFAMAFE